MLVVTPTLIVVLPDLIEVKGIEKLDRAVECCYDQSDVLHVSQLRDRLLRCLVRIQSRLSCPAVLAALLPCVRLHSISPIKCPIVVLRTDIFKRVLKDPIQCK